PVGDMHWQHAVWRMEYGGQDPPAVFLGDPDRAGGDDKHFSHPADVAVDGEGRLYVADHLNDRVQIFDADGKLLKSLKATGPTRIEIDGRTGQVHVFSWYMAPHYGNDFPQERKVSPRVRRFGPYPGLEPQGEADLPLKNHITQPTWSRAVGWQYDVALDAWAEQPTLWLIDDFAAYPKLLRWDDEGLQVVRDFHADAKKSGVRLSSPSHGRQRLYVDPHRGHLYLAEGDVGTGKAFNSVVRIDPDSGECDEIAPPFGASDMAFSPDGMAYLRTGTLVGRFDPITWREIPFDYGEEQIAAYSYDTRHATLQGALMLPSIKTNPHWHHGGMDVNVRGDLLVTCFNPAAVQVELRKGEGKEVREKPAPYRPRLYPGRYAGGRELHIWDRHGQMLFNDVIPGQPELVAGVGLDVHNNVYANISVSMMWPPGAPREQQQPYSKLVGHRYDPVGTLVKFRPNRGKLLSAPGPGTPINLTEPPDRPPELNGVWVEDAEWIYPGVGRVNWGMDCSCWNSRITLDYFARTFAPEYDRCSIAVLDTAGNLVPRIGTYGNVEGREDGDRVTLFDGSFVATRTDRRLFIADPGNARILSVKLDYHATETVAVKERRGPRE
ncbi:MAG: hypothetical protein WD069_11270, partial [Planctomycetales bacterium]